MRTSTLLQTFLYSQFLALCTSAQLTTTKATVTSTFVPSSTSIFTASSTAPPDPWQCATKNLTQYLDVPKPTGTLLSAIESFGDVLLQPCLSTATGLDILSCSVSQTTQWCSFATAAPSSVKPAYSAYGSSASSWWFAKSSAITSLEVECARTWEKFPPIQVAWLNQTIAHAKCYKDAHPGEGGGSGSVSGTTKVLATAKTSATSARTSSK